MDVDGGLPLIYTFTNAQGNAVQIPLGLARRSKPGIEAYSPSGDAYFSKFDQTVSPNTLRIYNGANKKKKKKKEPTPSTTIALNSTMAWAVAGMKCTAAHLHLLR